MPSIKWQHVWGSPKSTVKIVTLAILRSISETFGVVTGRQDLSIRVALTRIWVGTAQSLNHNIFYSEPAGHEAQKIETDDTITYVIPTTNPEEIRNADAVYIYAHGGGMFIGHPLQYLNEYRRWVKLAAEVGKRIVILAPVYPLSPQKKWPAQREAFLGSYEWALSQSIPVSKIIFGGDSAGADIVLLSLLYLRDHTKTPPPAAAVLHSPSIDMTGERTRFTPRVKMDFLFEFTNGAPFLNDLLRPDGLPFDTPEISALLAKDVSRLPPQLVYWSTTEVLASDAERWIQRSREAGIEIVEHKVTGQLHTYGLGFPFVGKALERECDKLLIEYIFNHV